MDREASFRVGEGRGGVRSLPLREAPSRVGEGRGGVRLSSLTKHSLRAAQGAAAIRAFIRVLLIVHLPVLAFKPHNQPLTVTSRKVSAAISRCRRLAGRATAAAARRGPTAPGWPGRPVGQPVWLGRRPSQNPGSRRWGR